MPSNKKIVLFCLSIACVGFSFADVVSCDSQKYFSDNSCQVCLTGGDADITSTGVTVSKQDFSWENTLDGINQNFYQSGQDHAQIFTNLGTAPKIWDEAGLIWGTDVVWRDLDSVKSFSLDPGKTIALKTLKDKTSLPLTDMVTTADPYVMIKIPLSYYELKMGTFKESEKKITNYCISYIPKKSQQTNTATPSTTASTTAVDKTKTESSSTATSSPTQTTVSSDSSSGDKTQATSSTTTTSSSTTSSPTKSTSDTSLKTALPSENTVSTDKSTVASSDTSKIQKDTVSAIDPDAIPTYHPKSSKLVLNSAGADPKDMTRVESGPKETFIIIASILLSVLVFPKLSRTLLKNSDF